MRTLLAAVGVAALSAFGVACVPDQPPPTSTTTTTVPDDPWAPGQCFESVDPFTAALYYVGPLNTLNNAWYATRGNNCAEMYTPQTVVRAADLGEATALCQSIKGTNAVKLTETNIDPPEDGYFCY